MHWVYVLESDEGDIYVGETTRLFRRFNEHQSGRGGSNTSRMNIQKLKGLYKVGNNISFLRYKDELIEGKYNWKCPFFWGEDESKEYACEMENSLTKQYICKIQDVLSKPFMIRGGYLLTEDKVENFIFLDEYKNYVAERPLCYCGSPAEVNLSMDKTKIYFNCPISKPSNWNNFYGGLEIPEKCNFYQEFKPYSESKQKYEQNRKKQYEWWVSKLPIFEGGKCIKCKTNEYNPIWSVGKNYSCCEECFDKYYDSLKNEYAQKPRDLSSIFNPE
jgi:predicted GIY-YIG superfamily endonuclease